MFNPRDKKNKGGREGRRGERRGKREGWMDGGKEEREEAGILLTVQFAF